MNEEQARAFQALPTPQSCRVINFDSAQVLTLESLPLQHVLVVSGQKPLNVVVSLTPLVYIRQPEYWGIEVIGCVPGLGLPTVAPYVVRLDLDGTIGTCGIEVIGANRSEKIDIFSHPVKPQGSFTLSITSSASGELIANASLTCPPDGTAAHPNPVVACEQLSRVDGRIEGIPEDPGPCTLEFNPVIVAASGTWNGESRHYKQEFSNRCVAVRATGGVIFDF